MRVETDRLILRSLEPEDAPLVRDFYLRNRAFFAPWDPARDEAFFELASFADSIAREREELVQRRSLKLYLFEKDGDAIVGYLGLSNIVLGPFLSAFLGYKLDEARRGRGYMTEALRAAIGVAFRDYGLHRIEANIMPRNAPSVRLVLRLGFEREGGSPKYLRIAGAWEDHDHYVLRNRDME